MKRSHDRHLPRLEVFCPDGYGRDALGELALRASYVGSVDHKAPGNSFGFPPAMPRRDASVCDSGITRVQAEGWLREAIRKGNFQWTVASERFPRYVFYRVESQWYIGRLTNERKGEYKGYPVQEPVTIRGVRS